jgi:hypothetical protein
MRATELGTLSTPQIPIKPNTITIINIIKTIKITILITIIKTI